MRWIVLTVKQAAERLGVSAQTIYALCSARLLRHSRIGLGRGRIVISEEAIAEYLRATENGASCPQVASLPQPVKLKHLRL